jgi:hypothetical protein
MSEDRKVLVAVYKTCAPFVIPKDVDLNAPGVTWTIKWNVLYIDLPDGRNLIIDSACDPEGDFKYPSETEIVPGDDWDWLFDDED